MTKKLWIYPGSFDPPTLGHLDMIRRGAGLCDELIVGVLHNPAKRGLIPAEERVRLLEKLCTGLPGVRVVLWDGLLADLVKHTGACAVLRGLRNGSDFEYEQTMGQLNSRLLPGLETLCLMTDPRLGCVSSSAVRELLYFGRDISGFVPDEILEDVTAYGKQD